MIDLNKEGIGANIEKLEDKYIFSSIIENGPVSKSELIEIGDEIIEI